MAAWALALVLMLPAAGHAVSIGIATEPATLDPRFGTDAASARIQELVHCRLVRVDEKGLPQPMLAQSWRRLDPYTWRFALRRGWRFADGRPVRAQDVAATLNAARDPRLGSPLAAQLAEIAEIHAERDALVVRARTPDPMLPVRLSVGVLPKDAAHAPPMPRHPPSCGPYRMISWNNGVIRLAKTGNAPRTAPEGIVFRVVPDPTTRALKLARGELDLIQGDIPAHLVPFLRRRARIRLVARPSLTFAYIGLNLRKPPLSDRRVRQALAMAIDRKALIEGLFGGLPVPAETILPPEHWAGVELPPYPFDPDAAERLLDEAGYPRRPDGVRFTITYRTSTNAERIWLAQAIQAMWRRIGVRAKIESLEWGAFYARIKRGDFDVFSLAWVGVRDPEIYRWILHSQMTPPRGANRGGFRDPEVDRWLDAARSAPTLSARAALYRRVARRMHEALVYIPLWREPVIAAYRTDRIRRYRPSADGGFWHVLSLEAAPSQASASGQGPGSG